MATVNHLQILMPMCPTKMEQLAQTECLINVADIFGDPNQDCLVSASSDGCPPSNRHLQDQHAAKTRAKSRAH